MSSKPRDPAAAVMGIPSYPGAKLVGKLDDIEKTVKLGRESLKAFFTTPDQSGAVEDYYLKKLAKVDEHFMAGQAAHVSGRTASGLEVIMSAVADAKHPNLTQIQVLVVRPAKKK